MQPTRLTLAWIVLLLLFVTLMGARQLDADGIWYDEWYSLYTAGASVMGAPLSPAEVWTRVATEDPVHPPAYNLLLSLWGRAVGWSEAAARSLSLLLGVLAVACIYRLGRVFGGSPVAFGAALTAGASGAAASTADGLLLWQQRAACQCSARRLIP